MTLKKLPFFLILLAAFIVACSGDAAQDIQDVAEQVGDAADQVADNADEIVDQAEDMVNAVVEELSCSDAIGCVEIAAGDPIKLASALVVTGPNESLGLDSQYGVEIAIADRGEMMGHEVVLQAEDDGCSAEGGQTAGQKIVSDPSIVGVVGTSCSGAGVPMSQIVCESGVVMVSPSNTAPVLTGADTRQSCYFRTAHNDKIQGAAMATFVFEELGITKAAAIHDGDPYTEGLASVFRDSFTELGGEIVAFEAEAADATNVEPLLTSVAAAGPELIYYPVFIPLGSLLTKTAKEIDGLAGVTLAAADGVLSPDFIEAAGDASEGMYMSGPDLGFGNDIYTQFLATYESEYGTEPTAPFHAHAYDATNMILDAIAAVAQVDADGNMMIGRQALIDQVGSTSGMAGITGTLTCDANGDCADARIAVNQIQAGEFVPVAGAADTMSDEAMDEDVAATITIWADDTRAPILAELAAGFQAEYGIALDVQQVPDINDQFPIAAPAGEGPDILILAHDRIGGFYASGLLAPLDMGGRESEFLDTAISAFTYEGELVGMPYAVENLAFFYNADLVDGPPATWDEAMEVGGALVESGDATYAIALTGTTYDMYPLQTSFGGYVFGRDAAGNYNPEDVGIDSDGMIAAGDFLGANIEAGLISNSTDWDTAHLQFETGEIPYLMAGPWALDRLRESGVNYGIASFPDGGAPFLGVQGFAVNALSENVLLAQTFLTEFVATAEVMQALADSGNRPTAFNAVTQADADLVAFNDAGVEAQPMPAIPAMGSVWGSWGDAFTLIMNGESDASDALTNGAAQVRALIGGSATGMVNVPGSWQSAAGFDCDWAPDCIDTALADNGDGTYSGTFDIPAGEYETKVALEGAWTENYGIDGAADGENYVFTLDADSSVTFTFDSDSKLLDIAIGGESSMAEASMADLTPVRVCEVTDVGGIDDKSFNATAWVGAQNAAEATGGEAQYLESQQQTDYERNIGAFIDDGCDLIVGVGFLLGDAIAAAAETNPDQNFTIIDFAYDPTIPNVVGQVYASNQPAFLAGMIAADSSETGIVGVYGGINIPPVTDFMDGFVLGVAYYNELNGTEIEVLGWDIEDQDGLFIGNFESTDDGRTTAESLMDEGADVIFPLAGAAGLGSGAAIMERGNAWMIGADTDWRVSAPEFADITLTSTLKRMDISMVDVAMMVATDSFEGGLYVGTLENGGVGITDGPYDLDLSEITQMIIDGDVVTTP
ncbi:MAG: extracellular solute-binding protein [Candidatus Promineifilaceae bacterium]